MTAISTPPKINLTTVSPQQFLLLNNQEQADLIQAKDTGTTPLWLCQVKTAIKRGNRLSFAFLTPDRNSIDAMDSIFNKFSK